MFGETIKALNDYFEIVTHGTNKAQNPACHMCNGYGVKPTISTISRDACDSCDGMGLINTRRVKGG